VWRWMQLSLINMRCTGMLMRTGHAGIAASRLPKLAFHRRRDKDCPSHYPGTPCVRILLHTNTDTHDHKHAIDFAKAIAYRRPASLSLERGALARC